MTGGLLGRGRSIVAEGGGVLARMDVYEPAGGAPRVSVEITEGGRVVWAADDCAYEPSAQGLMRAVEEHAS